MRAAILSIPASVLQRVGRFLLVGLALLLAAPSLSAKSPHVAVVEIDGAIGPASADYVTRALKRAERDGALLVVLQMDTPGGLDPSMRRIIRAILASPVPVASFVAPSGARAASAGTYILYASHIAAMAPGTNLGAATPISIGGPPEPSPTPSPAPSSGASAPSEPAMGSISSRKQISDATAYIRSLAQMRGRNVQWAEQAVRDAASLPAQEALQAKVIEYVATDVGDLLKQLDGKTVKMQDQARTLKTAGAPIFQQQPDWRHKLLAVITDPSVALILMMIGVYGLFFEFSSPGAVIPGVLGGICLLLGLYALQLLPVNYAGLALITLGIAFMVSEAFFPSFGILGLGGIVAFVIGAVILIDTELPGYGIPIGLIVGMAVLSAGFIIGLAGMALRARRRVVVSGDSTLIGQTARVLETTGIGLWVELGGERWRATSAQALQPGQKVRVISRRDLTLEVAPVPGSGVNPGGG